MKDEADIVAETLRETEPVKVLERRREALEKFYVAKQRDGEGEDEGRASPATDVPPARELPAVEPATAEARRGGSWRRVLVAAVVAALSPFAVVLGGHFKETASKATPGAAPTPAPVIALDTAPAKAAVSSTPPATSATAAPTTSALLPPKPTLPKRDAGRPTPGEVW